MVGEFLFRCFGLDRIVIVKDSSQLCVCVLVCVSISGRGCGIYIYSLSDTIPEYPVTLDNWSLSITDRDRGE